MLETLNGEQLQFLVGLHFRWHRLTGTLVNDRDYRRMSQGIMNLIHGEEQDAA